MFSSSARLGGLLAALPVPRVRRRLHVSDLANDFGVKALQAAAQQDLRECHNQLVRPCTGGHEGQLPARARTRGHGYVGITPSAKLLEHSAVKGCV